jgi:hypothetical protein
MTAFIFSTQCCILYSQSSNLKKFEYKIPVPSSFDSGYFHLTIIPKNDSISILTIKTEDNFENPAGRVGIKLKNEAGASLYSQTDSLGNYQQEFTNGTYSLSVSIDYNILEAPANANKIVIHKNYQKKFRYMMAHTMPPYITFWSTKKITKQQLKKLKDCIYKNGFQKCNSNRQLQTYIEI